MNPSTSSGMTTIWMCGCFTKYLYKCCQLIIYFIEMQGYIVQRCIGSQPIDNIFLDVPHFKGIGPACYRGLRVRKPHSVDIWISSGSPPRSGQMSL